MQCTSPVHVVNPKTGHQMTVPCGHCMSCRLQKTREWQLRLLNELNYWNDACFQTLTYRDEDRPTLPCGKSYLKKDDLQKFHKRLRKYFRWLPDSQVTEWNKKPIASYKFPTFSARKIKFYACGEYGEKNHNCHFHGIYFGISVGEMKKAIPKIWTFGESFLCSTGTVTADSIQYVTGYVRKKLSGKGKLMDSYFWCLPAEFSLQSQGFGLNYANDYSESIIANGMTIKGSPVSIPRYYDKKVEEIAKVIQERSKKAISQAWSDFYAAHPVVGFDSDYLSRFAAAQCDIVPDFESIDSKRQRAVNLKSRMSLYKKKL